MKLPFFLVISGLLLLASPTARAIVDVNHNGLSDLWEKHHNSGNLFPTNCDPLADPDGDGWTHAQEAAVGSDPFDANPPHGYLQPAIVHIPAVMEEDEGDPVIITPEAVTVTWQTLVGKHYTLLFSPDLQEESWIQIGKAFVGSGSEVTYGFEVSGGDKQFWRVAVTDADTDGDTLTDAEERAIGSSPYFPDTDGDGIDDFTAYNSGLNPAGEDSDGDGTPDSALYSVKFELHKEIHNSNNYSGWDYYKPFMGSGDNFRYLTYKNIETYSSSGAALSPDVADAKRILTYTFLGPGKVLTYPDSHIEYPPPRGPDSQLGEGESRELDPSHTSVVGPTTAPSEIKTVTTTTTAWRIKKQGNTIRSGVHTQVTTAQQILSDGLTYQDYWATYVKPLAWTEFFGGVYGPTPSANFLRGIGSDKWAAETIRDYFSSGNFYLNGIIASPSLGYFGSYGEDTRLKRVRWRWVRFNPLNPFDYEYASPPAAYQKTFHFLVEQTERLGASNSYYGQNPVISTKEAKGIIEIECAGNEGSDWKEISLEKFNTYRIDDPTHLAAMNFTNWGYSTVSFSSLPVEVVSRDKFLAGSFSIPTDWDSLEMEFVGPDGSLGKYGNLLGGGSTKIYDKVEDIMADSDYAAGGQVATQKVWFVKDSTDARKINYYTCFDSTGEVKIKLYLNGKPEPLGEITHNLTAAPDFAAVIDYVDEWVKGTSFDFTGGVITPPLAMRAMSMNAAGGGGIHNLTRAALIPFFNVVSNVEGLGSVAFGLFDGIKEGVSDDYKLLVLIKSGVLGAGGWAIQAAEAELNKWKDDPLKRAAELKKAADRLCQEWVFKPMEQVQADLSTWEGFKKRSWQTWKSVEGTANKAWVLTQSSWGSIKTGLKDWVNDFADRMMEGAEKAHWSENLLVMDKISGDLNEVTRQASYTFGYTFGYISEQVAVGILTGGTVKIGAVMTKGGAAMATQLAARRVLPVVARLQFVKKWAASVAISIEMKVAVERGLIIAAETPLSLAVKDSAAEVIERGMKRATFERTAFSNSKVLDEVIAALNIKKLILTPGREGQFWYKFALFFEVMGEKATAPASKGWVKAYNRLLKFNGDVLESDRAGDLLALYKAESTAPGREALRKSLDDFAANANPAALHPDLKFLDIENVATKGYRYAGDVDWLAQRGWSYPAHSGGGWYCTFDDMAESLTAKGRLQLPVENSARYKIEFDTIPIKSNTYVPYGRLDNAEWFEPLARDYPDFGVGGGTQFLVKDAEIVINRVIDLSTNPPTVIFTRP